MIATQGCVVGVDVGYSLKRRSSAICRLDWSSSSISWEIVRFTATEPDRESTIAKIVSDQPIMVAAFDGPLRQGFDIIGEYRTAERMLTRRVQPHIGKPGQSSSPVGRSLNKHANICAHHVITRGNVQAAQHDVAIDQKAVVEAFPTSFLGLMIDDPAHLPTSRKARSDRYFCHLTKNGGLRALIEHCLPGRRLTLDLEAITNHDDRAGLVCALTALCVTLGEFVAVGDSQNGWIILPPRQFIKPAQWALLSQNACEEASALHIAGRVSEAQG